MDVRFHHIVKDGRFNINGRTLIINNVTHNDSGLYMCYRPERTTTRLQNGERPNYIYHPDGFDISGTVVIINSAKLNDLYMCYKSTGVGEDHYVNLTVKGKFIERHVIAMYMVV